MKLHQQSATQWILHIGLFLVATLTVVLLVKALPFSGVYDTHDGTNHLARFANYRIALREGQIPPRWAPNLLNHYGYPVFLLNYPLANIASLPLTIGGLSYEQAFSVLSLMFIVIGCTGIYFWLRGLFQQTSTSALLFSISAYGAAPFLWNILFIRGSIGELAAYALFPWVLFSFESLRTNKNTLGVVLAGVLYSAFLLSHNVSAVIGSVLLIVWLLSSFSFDYKIVKKWLLAGILGLSLVAWFWVPALLEAKETVVFQAANNSEAIKHLLSTSQLLFSPLSFGYSYPGLLDSLSFQVGLPYLFAVILTTLLLIFFFRTKKTEQLINIRPVIVALVLIVLLLFLQTNTSAWLWQLISQLSIVQFPWRFSLFTVIFTIPVIHWLWRKSSLFMQIILVIMLLLMVISEIAAIPNRVISRPDAFYETFPETTSTQHENMPKSFTYLNIADWKPEPSVLSGKAEIQVIQWNGSRRTYRLVAMEPSVIIEPTAYFHSWRTTLQAEGNETIQIASYIDSDTIQGRLAYTIEPGTYLVSTSLRELTGHRVFAVSFSIIAIFSITIVLLIQLISLRKEPHQRDT